MSRLRSRTWSRMARGPGAHGEAALEWLSSSALPVDPQQACLREGYAPCLSASPAVASGTAPGDAAASASPAAVEWIGGHEADDESAEQLSGEAVD